VKLDAVRAAALALPGTTEEPHHDFGSFRVRGKIFATFPPDRGHLHLFPDEANRELALAACSEFAEKLLWGGKVVGVRVTLARADAHAVETMLRQAYDYKAPRERKAAAPPVSDHLAALASKYVQGMTSIRGRRVQRLLRREFAGAELVALNGEGVLGVSSSGAAFCATDGRGPQATLVQWRHGATEAVELQFDLLKDSLPVLATRTVPVDPALAAEALRLRR